MLAMAILASPTKLSSKNVDLCMTRKRRLEPSVTGAVNVSFHSGEEVFFFTAVVCFFAPAAGDMTGSSTENSA